MVGIAIGTIQIVLWFGDIKDKFNKGEGFFSEYSLPLFNP